MIRFLRYSLALLLGACSVPTFNIAPDDPCVAQVATGKLCGGVCAACEDGQSCELATDCTSGLCDAGTCAPMPTCSDGLINGSETGIDCGGGVCDLCGLGASCTRGSDCASTLCTAGVCAAMPTCTDGVINGTETDTDCGGDACNACPLDAHCTRVSDCASGLCQAGVCAVPVADPTCKDNQKNGSETDTDCGGSACDPCPVDKRCSTGSDCVTLVCASVCQPAGCKDNVRNGAETDKDCGGGSCSACDVGLVCKLGSDCKSLSCSGGHCIADTCSDGIKNGTETGKDCGGGTCGVCPPNQGCSKGSDCDSLICAANKTCTQASCSDGVKNGTESVTDCGKGCKGCDAGLFCNTNADCASALCTQNYCVPTAPSGSVLDPSTWLATASDTFSNSLPSYGIDNKPTTRWSSGTPQYVGMSYVLDMKKPQIFFGLTLDTQDQPGDAPVLFDVYLSMDSNFTGQAAAKSITGIPLTNVTFTGNKAVVARYIKIVLTNNKPSNWWGFRELTVNN